jgi:hypothetical protein
MSDLPIKVAFPKTCTKEGIIATGIRVFLFSTLVLFTHIAFSQVEMDDLGLEIKVSFRQELNLGGYIQVRENELPGSKLELEDLNIFSYPSLQLQLTKRLKENQQIVVSYNRIYLKGKSTINQDLAFNGTLIDARQGVDVSPTRYYRLTAYYSGLLKERGNLKWNYLGGFVYDFLDFYLDGKVSPKSSRFEVFEGFYRQALPYPVIGSTFEQKFTHHRKVEMLLLGTYVPRFTSFYVEGGKMDLQYSTFETNLTFSQQVKYWNIGLCLNYRFMKLFQESREDTNLIESSTLSPGISIAYVF